MRNSLVLSILLSLAGCNGAIVVPPVDAGVELEGDAAPDARLIADAGPVDAAPLADAGEEDASAEPDASSSPDAGEEPDASMDTIVAELDACRAVRDAWEATGCNPEAYWCGYAGQGDQLSSDVDACTSSIESADGCLAAHGAMNRCGS